MSREYHGSAAQGMACITMRILFVTAEFAPLVKTGGLGDVSAALPAALAELGHDVRVLLPGYPAALDGARRKRAIAALAAPEFPPARILRGEAPSGCTLLLIDCPPLYRRGGDPYQDDDRRDWPDNALRFGLLGRAAALLCAGAADDDWRPDLLHCNDWHAALAPVYLRSMLEPHTPSVLTVHNLAFQGIFPAQTAATLGLPDAAFSIDGVEYYGQLSFLKGGLSCADWLTTVSPTYAREIQGEAHGCGLDGLLRKRRDRLTGILNGIDTKAWDPATDPHLARNYTRATVKDKSANKRALQRRMHLAPEPSVPLFGAVGRLTGQKGSDLLCEIAPSIAALPAQLVVLGAGDPELERRLRSLELEHRGRIAVRIGFDEPLAHLIEAGSDCFLMPSRFEPCGMNQMYSQRYGTPPVVHRTGGLADAVTTCTAATLASGKATGFTFLESTPESFLASVKRAHRACRDPRLMHALQRNGMARDFGWKASAQRYVDIYERLRRRRPSARARGGTAHR